MKIEWDKTLEIGNLEIDGQHKELFKRVNSLLEAMDQGKGSNEIMSMLKFLEDYSKTHFAEEEKLMEMHNYPGLRAQKAEHAEFIKNLETIKKEIAPPSMLPTTIRVYFMTVNWLENHILKMDKEIGKFLKRKRLLKGWFYAPCFTA